MVREMEMFNPKESLSRLIGVSRTRVLCANVCKPYLYFKLNILRITLR